MFLCQQCGNICAFQRRLARANDPEKCSASDKVLMELKFEHPWLPSHTLLTSSPNIFVFSTTEKLVLGQESNNWRACQCFWPCILHRHPSPTTLPLLVFSIQSLTSRLPKSHKLLTIWQAEQLNICLFYLTSSDTSPKYKTNTDCARHLAAAEKGIRQGRLSFIGVDLSSGCIISTPALTHFTSSFIIERGFFRYFTLCGTLLLKNDSLCKIDCLVKRISVAKVV